MKLSILRRPALTIARASDVGSGTASLNPWGKSRQCAWKSTEALSIAERTEPTLHRVPSLPVVGSLLTSYSGMPEYKPDAALDYWPEMRRRYGDFYTVGIPGLGSGSHGTTYVIQDVKEMMKIIRKEGKHPSGAIELSWALKKYCKNEGIDILSGLFGRGAAWKRSRDFLQTDLLSPQSANRYVQGVLRSAMYASRGAADRSDNLKDYLNDASFDMFSMILLGGLPRISDPTIESDPEDVEFCRSVATALGLTSFLIVDVNEVIMGKLGITSRRYREFHGLWNDSLAFARLKVERLLEKDRKKELTPEESSSYAINAMKRQAEGDGSITREEAIDLVSVMLAAGVDTTSGYLGWHLLHIAINKHAQETIYEEVRSLAERSGGRLNEGVVDLPFLNATLRESHRLTSAVPPGIIKGLAEDAEVHGETVPAGSIVVFDSVSKGYDPDLVENPEEFRPERWLPDAIAARKGSPAAVLDHPFYSGPFSQGARRCPGSRVAKNESLVFLAQLVLDWEIEAPVKSWRDVPYGLQTVNAPFLPKLEFTPRQR